MKKWMIFSLMFIVGSVVSSAYAYENIQLGLLTANKKLGPVAEAAYEWANTNYPTTMLVVEQAGKFSDDRGNLHQLTEFAVLWWHYSESQNIPASFLENGTQDAIKSYVKSGGALFLTALALHYVFDLGIETSGDPRKFGKLGNGTPQSPIGVVPTKESKEHPIFEGFDTSKVILLNSMSQEGFTSDFYNIPGGLKGKVLADKWRGSLDPKERPLVEYDFGKGKIIVLGHHDPTYTDKKSDEGKNLRQLTANIILYLAQNSAFRVVEPKAKLVTTWGDIKIGMDINVHAQSKKGR